MGCKLDVPAWSHEPPLKTRRWNSWFRQETTDNARRLTDWFVSDNRPSRGTSFRWRSNPVPPSRVKDCSTIRSDCSRDRLPRRDCDQVHDEKPLVVTHSLSELLLERNRSIASPLLARVSQSKTRGSRTTHELPALGDGCPQVGIFDCCWRDQVNFSIQKSATEASSRCRDRNAIASRSSLCRRKARPRPIK